MKASLQVTNSAMQLCFKGESLRNVQKFLRLQGVTVSHVAVSGSRSMSASWRVQVRFASKELLERLL